MATNNQTGAGANPTARRTGTSLGGSSTTGTSGLVDTLRNQASSQLTTQKERAAAGLGSVVEAVRQTGQQLRGKNDALAGYAESAAAQLEGWSSQLRERDLSELVDDVKMFARRRPALFLGGGVALGVIAARILKSSGERQIDAGAPQRFTSAGRRGVSMDTRRAPGGGVGATGGARAADMAADRTMSRPKLPGTPTSDTGR